jgi:uncharacterized membrane protein YidH (DUF202 family)
MKAPNHEHEDDELRNSMALIRTIEAEKRTYLAELRTGIGILTISLSLLTILIATSNYYSIQEVFAHIIGLILGILLMGAIGFYLAIHSLQKLRAKERLKRDSCLTTEEIAERYRRQDH